MGEVVASSAVVEALRQKFPSHRVLVSTTTSTGQKLAAQRFGAENVFYFPLDFAFAMRPYLEALHPELVVIAETEFWPNFLRLAKRSGARIAVINCRISDRSLPGYKRLRFWLPRVLENARNVDLFLAQTEEDRRRLVEIGATEAKVTVAGNLKFDVAPPPCRRSWPASRELQPLRSGAGSGVWQHARRRGRLAALGVSQYSGESSQGGDDPCAAASGAFCGGAALVEQLGFRMWRRSLWSGEALAGGVFLVDSIGELAALYSLATVAFVGGSLVPRGGHNILEPALYGVPIVTGNHYENFRDIVNFFASRNAVRIVGLAELPLVFMELIENGDERTTLGRNALAALESQRGATARTVAALVELMSARIESRDPAAGQGSA